MELSGDRSPGRLRRGVHVAIAGAIGGLVLLNGLPLCPMAAVLGVPCPGCGLTRATLAALRGDVHAAWHFHPLVFAVSPIAVLFALNAVVEYVRGTPFTAPSKPSRWLNAAAMVLIVLMLALWIARFLGAFGGPVPVVRWWG